MSGWLWFVGVTLFAILLLVLYALIDDPEEWWHKRVEPWKRDRERKERERKRR